MINEKITTIRETTDKSWQEIADEINREFDTDFSMDAVRFRYNRHKNKENENEQKDTYKEQHKILENGSHYSDKLLRMSEEQKKDPEYLLEAHGFNPDKWELAKAESNIWNVYSKIDKVQQLYSSRITARPKQDGMDWNKVVEKISNIKPEHVEPTYTEVADYFHIPLFDMHFGVSDFEYYKPTQAKIIGLLENCYKEVLIPIGQDLLHNDDMRGRTSSGREIEKVNMEKAWDDAMSFYYPIIYKALEKSGKVTVKYSPGNHDESMSWCFVKALSYRFPQATFDTQFKQRKAHMLGLNFIGFDHGDKKKEVNLSENFATEFPLMWSKATTREVYTGHLHSERVIDKGGMLIHRMSTRNKIDGYHDDYGYTMAHKRFIVKEYSETEVLGQIYV